MNCVVLKYNSEVKHVRVNLNRIYLGVIKPYTVRSLKHKLADIFNKILIGTALTGDVIQTLIIVDPESNIPGLIIRPTVIGSIQSVGLKSDSHLVSLEC